jgi:hypothetical protein
MLRHYSANRGTVLSLALPICMASLGWALTTSTGSKLGYYLIASEALLYIYALVLFAFFSSKYEEARRILVRIEAGDLVMVYNSLTAFRRRSPLPLDGMDRALLILSVFVHGSYYIVFFQK